MAWMDKYCMKITNETLARRTQKDVLSPTADEIAECAKELQALGYSQTPNANVFMAITEFCALAMHHRPRKGLLLKGECGIGKTFGLECVAKMTNARFIQAAAFLQAYKDGFTGNEFQQLCEGQNFFGEKCNMVIDELGGEPFPFVHYGQRLNLMADVLEVRYQCYLRDGLWTCVTTNLTDRDLVERYGERINDRLNEMCVVRYLKGASLRKGAQKP